jgi:serine/threonine protein phosphatase PrpC
LNYIPDPLSLDYYGCSDIGMVRIENQDSLGKFPKDNLDLYTGKGQLFIVADGMGGHAGGRLASTTAVETMISYFGQSFDAVPETLISESISEANRAIYEKAKESAEYKKMGTTCVVLLLKENLAAIGHVGDSRIYLIENGKIEQLTTDHTQVQEMLKRGILTPEEAAKHPARSVLARALGVDPGVESDVRGGIPLRSGQIFILCTDGLSKVTGDEILEISSTKKPKEACDKLIALANERGGKDNVTVQIIKIGSLNEVKTEVKEKKKSHYMVYLFLIIIAAAILLFGGDIIKLFMNSKEESVKPVDKPRHETINIQDTDKNAGLISKADELLKRGRYDGALEIYKSILKDEPMHLSALNGVNRIITLYTKRGDILKDNSNYKDALIYYYKVEELQPGNKKVLDNIILCRNQLKYNSVGPDSSVIKDSTNEISSQLNP